MQLPPGCLGPNGISEAALGLDDRQELMRERISISRQGRLWAITHAGSYLGYARSSEEAARIGRHLADWFIDQGRAADVVIVTSPLIRSDVLSREGEVARR